MSLISRLFNLVAAKNVDGVRGAFGARSPDLGGMVGVIGADVTGFESQVSNLPVMLDGSAIYIDSDASVFFKITPNTFTGPNYAALGTPFVSPWGDHYTRLQVGPEIPIEQEEEFSDPTDWDLKPQGTTVTVVSDGGVGLASSYTADTFLNWQCWCENLGDRSADYVIQPRWNGVPLGPPTVVTLSNSGQLVAASVRFTTPPAAGDLVDLQVTTNNWGHVSRPDPWVLGSVEPSKITVFQEAAARGITSASVSGDGAQSFLDGVPDTMVLAVPDVLPIGWAIAANEVIPQNAVSVPLVVAFAVTVEASSSKGFELKIVFEEWDGAIWTEIIRVASYGAADGPESMTVACPSRRIVWSAGKKYRLRVTCTKTLGVAQTYTVIPAGTWLTISQGWR